MSMHLIKHDQIFIAFMHFIFQIKKILNIF